MFLSSTETTNLLYVEHDDDLNDDNDRGQRAEEEATPQQCLVVDEVDGVSTNVELPGGTQTHSHH